jgi:hypothetical protein
VLWRTFGPKRDEVTGGWREREEHRLRVFENRVLRRIFGPKRDEVTGWSRKVHNKEHRDLYSSPSIIRIMKTRRLRWAGHVARLGERRKAYRLLVGKPEGRRPLARPRHRWVDNLVEVVWGGVDWIGLVQDRDRWRALVNAVMNLRVPLNAGKLSSVLTTRDLSSSAQLHGVSFSYCYCYKDHTSIRVKYSLVILPENIFRAIINAAKQSTSTSQAKELSVGSSSSK